MVSRRLYLLLAVALAGQALLAAARPAVAEAQLLASDNPDAGNGTSTAEALASDIRPLDAASTEAAAVPAGTLQPAEERLLQLVNQARAEKGLQPLVVDPRLMAIARERSSDMAARGYFSHVTPEGTDVFRIMERQKIRYRLAAENLGRCNYPLVESPLVVHQAFLKSPGHAQNELDPAFDRIGIGVAVSNIGFVYFTELFVELDSPAS